jgi:ribosomal protein L11 methyltransferase
MADEAAGMLVACGALGCAIQGMRRAPARGRTVVKLEAFFPRLSAAKLLTLGRAMEEAGMLAPGACEPCPERIVDPGWATLWKKRFQPFRIGRRFLVVPPWNRAPEPGRMSIIVEPGRAFGTGHHPTTHGALLTFERLFAGRRFERALDVGTGSGILAIAMRRLGARKVLGIDVDRVALENATQNARLSDLSHGVRFASTPLRRITGSFDLIVANIVSATLIELAPELERLLAPDGRLVLGGILKGEARGVAAHYNSRLRLIDTRLDHGWATMVFAR